MNGISTPGVLKALSRLRSRDGVIQPEAVVDAARPESSVLHKYFEWDDTAAAEAHRLDQARKLLRVTVEYLETPNGAKRKIRAFVALSTDRSGYRRTTEVLVHSQRRNTMLDDAKAEALAFKRKYNHLAELAEVIAAINHFLRK